jgi:hypothetical protein
MHLMALLCRVDIRKKITVVMRLSLVDTGDHGCETKMVEL